jgi:hypothetical protein
MVYGGKSMENHGKSMENPSINGCLENSKNGTTPLNRKPLHKLFV